MCDLPLSKGDKVEKVGGSLGVALGSRLLRILQ